MNVLWYENDKRIFTFLFWPYCKSQKQFPIVSQYKWYPYRICRLLGLPVKRNKNSKKKKNQNNNKLKIFQQTWIVSFIFLLTRFMCVAALSTASINPSSITSCFVDSLKDKRQFKKKKNHERWYSKLKLTSCNCCAKLPRSATPRPKSSNILSYS